MLHSYSSASGVLGYEVLVYIRSGIDGEMLQLRTEEGSESLEHLRWQAKGILMRRRKVQRAESKKWKHKMWGLLCVCLFVWRFKVDSQESLSENSLRSQPQCERHFIYSTGGMSEMGKKNNINRNTKNIFKFTNCNRTLKLKDASCCSSDFLISSTKQTPTHHSFKVNRRSVSYACFYICRLLDFFFFHLFLIQ